MTQRIWTISLLVVLASFSSSISAEETAPQRILFIGNSYTAGTKAGIEFFLKQADRNVELKFIHPGGRRLSQHANDNQTLATIAEGNWDLVVLQEQSQIPSLPKMRDEYLQAGVQLTQAIRKADSDCLLFQTWGRRDGDKQNKQFNPDFITMQKRLSEGYVALGERTETPIAPVGQAWAIVHDDSPELFRKLYVADGSHPSALGAYLTGAVFYAVITGNDPGEVTALPRGVDQKEAAIFCAAAQKATK